MWQDVRYAARTLRQSPAFTTITIALLALGIGASVAIFTVLNVVVLRTMPVRDPSSLVEPLTRYPGDPRRNGFSWEFFEYVRDRNSVFTDVVGMAPAQVELRGAAGTSETVRAEYVVGTLFPALGMQPAIGRLIGPQDARAEATPVAVVSWTYWKNRHGLDPAVLGTHIAVNGVSTAVIGVAPRAFAGLQPGVIPELWLPVTTPRGLALLTRLKPGVSVEQARAEMRVLHRFRIEPMAKNDPRWLQADIELAPAGGGLSGLRDRFATPLIVLMAAVGLLLLIACTNVASMLLARAAARRHEMAVRVSLGAGHLRLARQVFTEAILLSATASLLGAALAYFGADALVRVINVGRAAPGWPAELELQLAPDTRVLIFTVAVAMLTAVIFGLAPAWSAFTSPPVSSLRQAGVMTERRSQRLFGRALVIAQVGLSVVLLSTAGVLAGHLSALRNHDLGFERKGVLLFTLNPQGSGIDRSRLAVLYRDLLDRLHAVPGVQSATLSGVTPIEGGAASRFASVDGHVEREQDRARVAINWIAPRYFETFRTARVAGRDFTFEEASGPPVAIINQAMARHYFGSGSPLGRRLTLERETTPYEIVGVVGDAKYSSLREPAPRTVYLHALQGGQVFSHFALRTSLSPAALASQVRSIVEQSVPRVAIAKVTTLDDQLNASIVIERVMTTLSMVFGVVGAVLVAIGLYGLIAYTVTRRTSEIGLRLALGATGSDVLRMVLTSAVVLTGAGIAIGVPVAWWTRRVGASLIENLSVGATWPIVAAAASLLLIALVAAYLPARRAARIPPVEALRHL